MKSHTFYLFVIILFDFYFSSFLNQVSGISTYTLLWKWKSEKNKNYE